MKKPSYIEYINEFWRFYDENRNELNVSDIVLYKVLLRYCNKISWINPFFIDPFLMSQVNPLSVNTYYKSLNNLTRLGLIKYEKGKHNTSKANITILKINNSTKASINNSLDNSIKFSVDNSVVNNKKTIIQKDNETIRLLNIEIAEKEKTIKEQALLISELELKLSKKKKPKAKPEPLHGYCKTYFLDYYNENKKAEYYWEVKDSVALNRIIKKIRSLGEDLKDGAVTVGFEKLIVSIKDFDSWVFDNLSVTLLNSKFNELISKIKANKKESEKKNSNEIDYTFLKERIAAYED